MKGEKIFWRNIFSSVTSCELVPKVPVHWLSIGYTTELLQKKNTCATNKDIFFSRWSSQCWVNFTIWDVCAICYNLYNSENIKTHMEEYYF